MITWADNVTKCCIILLNYATYTVYLREIIVKVTIFFRKVWLKCSNRIRNFQLIIDILASILQLIFHEVDYVVNNGKDNIPS